MSSIATFLEIVFGHKSGLILNYIGTLLIAGSTGFNTGVRFGGYPSVIATHPNFLRWGIVLIGLGFILQFLDIASLRIKIFSIALLLAPFVIKIIM